MVMEEAGEGKDAKSSVSRSLEHRGSVPVKEDPAAQTILIIQVIQTMVTEEVEVRLRLVTIIAFLMEGPVAQVIAVIPTVTMVMAGMAARYGERWLLSTEETAGTTTSTRPVGIHAVMAEMVEKSMEVVLLMEEMEAMVMRLTDFAELMVAKGA